MALMVLIAGFETPLYAETWWSAAYQEKPQLLICGNKFGSASVSRREADLD